MQSPTMIQLYWNTASHPEGWAYRVFGNNNNTLLESGALELALAADASMSELAEAVAWIATTYEMAIDAGSVVGSHIEDGGWALWHCDVE